MTGSKAGSWPEFQTILVPALAVAIISLAACFQWLVSHSKPTLAPGPLSFLETMMVDMLLGCVFWTYYKAWSVDPGRFAFSDASIIEPSDAKTTKTPARTTTSKQWCRICQAPKPPRAHHCRHCRRCIPKMDHHCPWVANCVSLQTFPHFLRFLVFANATLWTHFVLIAPRLLGIWHDRHLPSYLGPTLVQLLSIVLLTLVGMGIALPVGIFLVGTVREWLFNTTSIERWEIERHEDNLARRAALYEEDYERDYWDNTADAVMTSPSFSPQRVEFPYDVDLFANMADAMGTRNVLLWFWPFAKVPMVDNAGRTTGHVYAENGFNARPGMWPPPDPDKIRRARAGGWPGLAQMGGAGLGEYDRFECWTADERKAAFAKHQRADLLRKRLAQMGGRSGIMPELEELDEGDLLLQDQDGNLTDEGSGLGAQGMNGKPGWMDGSGDRPGDYGVDDTDEDGNDDDLDDHGSDGENGDAYDDENVPLAALMSRKTNGRTAAAAGGE